MIKLILLSLLFSACTNIKKCPTYYEMIPTTGSSYLNDLKECRIQLVYMGADWCPSCKKIKPTVEEIAKNYGGVVKVLFIDVTNPREDMREHKIGNGFVPYFKLIVDGQAHFMGNTDADTLDKMITGAIISLAFRDR